MIDAGTLEHAYKYTWSGFLGWEHRSHADNWVLLPDNLGPHLSIDESCLHDDLYDIVNKLRSIFRSKKLTRDDAKAKLHKWYQAVADCTIREIKSARDAIKSREENVLNYFIERSTNASAESFNSKLKAFRAQLRGIRDLPFFIFRICKVFG